MFHHEDELTRRRQRIPQAETAVLTTVNSDTRGTMPSADMDPEQEYAEVAGPEERMPHSTTTTTTGSPGTLSSHRRLTRLYKILSILLALSAVILKPTSHDRKTRTLSSPPPPLVHASPHQSQSSKLLNDRNQNHPIRGGLLSTWFSLTPTSTTSTTSTPPTPSFPFHLLLMQKKKNAVTRNADSNERDSTNRHKDRIKSFCLYLVSRYIDTDAFNNNHSTSTLDRLEYLVEKICSSTWRVISVMNLVLLSAYWIRGSMAHFFLGNSNNQQNHVLFSTVAQQQFLSFLCYKILLVGAVLEPAHSGEWLLLVVWYTLLGIVRSLTQLAIHRLEQTAQQLGQLTPSTSASVGRLLLAILFFIILMAAVCAGIVLRTHNGSNHHSTPETESSWTNFLVLVADCWILGLDVMTHWLRYVSQIITQQHEDDDEDDENNNVDAIDTIHVLENESALYARSSPGSFMSRKLHILENMAFVLTTVKNISSLAHFTHLWKIHGFQWTVLDGALGLHVHHALSTLAQSFAQRRRLSLIGERLNSLESPSSMEIRKSVAAGDVCCVCLGSLGQFDEIKKVRCGHLYHSACLRQVVERARSLEATKCPMCRGSIVDGSQESIEDRGQQLQTQQQNQVQAEEPQEQALFRFSTEGVIPPWLPFPSYAFEIVRRHPPPPPEPPRPSSFRRVLVILGFISMSQEEETTALTQLTEMFPQHDRNDLLRELRRRGSPEIVAELVLSGRLEAAD